MALLIVGGVILFIFLAIGIFLWTTYNGLKRIGNWTDNAFATIDVELKRRADLIPNIIQTVKGYAKHEKSTFEEIAKLRKEMVSGDATPKQKTDASNQLSGKIFALREAYPALNANQNFLSLQETLQTTEDRIASARGGYNTAVTTFNNKRDMLPTVFVANTFGFTRRDLLETPEAEREVVKVEF